MTSLNPYSPPISQLKENDTRPGIGYSVFVIMLLVVATEFSAWKILPLINASVAGLTHPFNSEQYWVVRYASDSILSVVLVTASCYFSAKLTRINPFLATLPIAIVGFGFFYLELGGFRCLGVCGPPLWYDLISCFKHIVPALVVAAIMRRKPQ